MVRDLLFRLRALVRRAAVERELDDEIRFHLEKEAEKYMAAGEGHDLARRRAVIALGGVNRVKEECRDARGVALVEDLMQDLRYGLRKLRRSPGFTVAVLVTLSLGIGINSALFSVANGVLLSPLPYPRADELVMVEARTSSFETYPLSFPNFRDWHAENRSFAWMALQRRQNFVLSGSGSAEALDGRLVSSEFFSVLGVVPVMGRGFARGEDEVGAGAALVISSRLWQRRFAGSPDVLGQVMVLDGVRYSVVGVVSSDLDVFQSGYRADVYVPMGHLGRDTLSHRDWGMGFSGIGRLRPGVSVDEARADLDRVARRLASVHPETNRGLGASVRPFKEALVGPVRPILLILLGAVGCVLLIACANVANLLLARATGRTREMAIRAAVGASRRRLLRQLLTESMLLAMAGGALGQIIAVWATPAALALLPPSALPRAGEVSLDGRVLVYTMAIALLCGLLFGLAPALKAAAPSLQGTLKDGGRGVSGSRHRVQSVLVVVQMAMVFVLLVGAGLMVRTLSRLWSADAGLDPRGVTTAWLTVPASVLSAGPAAIRAQYRQVEERMSAIPGVEAVSLSSAAMPMQAGNFAPFWIDGQPKPAGSSEMNKAVWYVVSPDYRRAMGIPLRAGRFLAPEDREGSPLVVVVDEVFARQYFGAESPIGKRIHVDLYDPSAEVVGVVGHVKQWGLSADDAHPMRAQFYFSLMQQPDPALPAAFGLIARAGNAAPVSIEAIRSALHAVHPDYVTQGGQTMDEVLSAEVALQRFAMLLLAGFAAVALLLASVGIYGVISYAVGQRTAEMGIRMALGARRWDVLGLVLRRGMALSLVGIAIGLAAALALTRLMAHLLYRVSATDPLTFVAVAGAVAAVALAACYVPARRAARVAPMTALRHE